MADRIVLNTISYHGHGAIENIVPELTARGYKKAFVCSDPDLIKFGVTKKVTDLLDAANFAYAVYSEIKPNPTIANVQDGVAAFKAAEADCIVTIGGSFQNSLETTSLLKELGAKCVVSRAERDVHAKFLLRNGADHVIYPEKQVAEWAAIRYTADHIFDYMEIDGQHAIFEVEVPHEWIGKSVGELNIRRKYGINILGIKHSGKTDVSITPDTVLSGEITILALGEYKALQKCFRI